VEQPSKQPISQRAPSGGVAVPGRRRGPAVVRSQFKTREVVDLLGLSRRQLQYWAKTGLVEPSERTPGGHHRYSFDDLVALKATKRLIDAGVSVQKIRSSVAALQALLPKVGRPLSELVLVATGDVVLVFQEDTVFEAVSGQEWVFEVADFEREVAAYRSAGSTEAGAHGPERPEAAGADGGPERMEAAGADGGAGQEETSAEAKLPARPGPRAARPDRGRSGEQDLDRTG
jgi:DNA-binding transcriptional MerR regulator